MASYKDMLLERGLLSWHYLTEGLFGEGRGSDFFSVLGEKFDEVQSWWKAATTASYVQFAPDDALPFLAQNYNLEKPEAFTAAQTRTMVDDAWNIWERSGGHEGILHEVARLGYTSCALLPVWAWKHRRLVGIDEIKIEPTIPGQPDHNPLFLPKPTPASRVVPPFGTDPEWGAGWWEELNLHYSSFWLVINPPHPFAFRRWGDPWVFGDGGHWDSLVTGDRTALRRLYLTLRQQKCANFSCRGILFTYPGYYPQPRTMWSVRTWSSYQAMAVGDNGTALLWNGVAWTPTATGVTENLFSVWGRSPSDVWAVGQFGRILHWDGAAWTSITSPTPETLTGVTGAGADLWACGTNGALLHYDGTSWSVIPPLTADGLLEMFSTGVNDVWAVGSGGVAHHYDGTAWITTTTFTASALFAIWGRSAADIWIGGDNGTLRHWDGAAWSAVASPNAGSVSSIWGTADGKAMATVRPAAAAQGELWAYDGATWSVADANVKTPAIGFGHLWGCHGTRQTNFWVAGDGGLWWCTGQGKIYWNAPIGGFAFGDGTRFNLNYALKRLREPWE